MTFMQILNLDIDPQIRDKYRTLIPIYFKVKESGFDQGQRPSLWQSPIRILVRAESGSLSVLMIRFPLSPV